LLLACSLGQASASESLASHGALRSLSAGGRVGRRS
jgi:hypothetical protein